MRFSRWDDVWDQFISGFSSLYLSFCLPYNVTTREWAWKWEHISLPSIHLPIGSCPTPCSHFSILCTCPTHPFELVSNPVLHLPYWVALGKSHNPSEPLHLWWRSYLYLPLRSCPVIAPFSVSLHFSLALLRFIFYALGFSWQSLKGILPSLSLMAAPACCTERMQDLGTFPNRLN